jgi:hypothetical protein
MAFLSKYIRENAPHSFSLDRNGSRNEVENAQKREASKLPRLEGHTLDEIAEERQELRDELDDENPSCQMDISPQEAKAAESSMVRNNALEIYL